VADLVAVVGIVADGAPVVLVGHSMGGALASHSCAALASAGIRLRGLVVLECVEGTALESMPVMEAAMRARPVAFANVDAATTWWLKAGMTRHAAAARPSLEAQLRVVGPAGQLGWRTDVAASIPHWGSWFTGQGTAFLGCPAPKLLLLSDARLLDTRLMEAHMTGRFQLVVVPQAGHALHEDAPRETAAALAAFIGRVGG
jgi:protein phosphatase methylesterase 1